MSKENSQLQPQPETITQPEQKKKENPEPYKASIKTPEESIAEWKKFLSQENLIRANFMFMVANNDLLDELTSNIGNTKAKVHIGLSSFDLLYPLGEPPLFPFLTRKNETRKQKEEEKRKTKIEFREGLKKKGIEIIDTCAQGIPPYVIGFAGQNHSKLAQFFFEDGTVVTSLPEFNLDSGNIKASNSALRFEESKEQAQQPNSIAKVVEQYAKEAYINKPIRDYEERITDKLLFLVDAGRVGRSIIMGKATGLVKERDTEDIFFASQFVPAGSVLDGMIKKAKEGKRVTVLLSDDCRPGRRLDIAGFHKKTSQLENFHVVYAKGNVHSKWLIVNSGLRAEQIEVNGKEELKFVWENDSNNMKGIASSNNLHPAGLAGTGEIGFLTKDQNLLKKMAKRVLEMGEEGEISLDISEKPKENPSWETTVFNSCEIM